MEDIRAIGMKHISHWQLWLHLSRVEQRLQYILSWQLDLCALQSYDTGRLQGRQHCYQTCCDICHTQQWKLAYFWFEIDLMVNPYKGNPPLKKYQTNTASKMLALYQTKDKNWHCQWMHTQITDSRSRLYHYRAKKLQEPPLVHLGAATGGHIEQDQ